MAEKVLRESLDDSDSIDVGLDQDFGRKAHQISRRSAIESRYGSNTVISVSETNYRSIRQKLFCRTRDLRRGGVYLSRKGQCALEPKTRLSEGRIESEGVLAFLCIFVDSPD